MQPEATCERDVDERSHAAIERAPERPRRALDEAASRFARGAACARRVALALRIVLAAFLLVRGLETQESARELRVLHTTDPLLDYAVDGVWRARDWHAQPELALDIFDVPRSTRTRRIALRSATDELAFDVAPGDEIDFIVRIDGVGDCNTRLSTRRKSARRMRDDGRAFVTLPFELDAHSRIVVHGSIDGSPPLRLMFDTGSNALVVFRSGRAKLRELHADESVANHAAGGSVERARSDGHGLELGDLHWPNEALLVFDQPNDCDGIFGYDLFIDKVVEIDCAARELRIHDELPASCAGTSVLPLRWEGALTALRVELDHAGVRTEAWPILDSGANGGLWLCAGFAREHGLPGPLAQLGTSRSRGLGPNPIESTSVAMPRLELGAHALVDMPVAIGLDPSDDHVRCGLLGMEVLKRFTLWIDYPRDALHMRPNTLFELPFARDYDDGTLRRLLVGVALLGATALALWLARRCRAR